MSGSTLAMLEMLGPFGLFLGFLIWQLVVTKRSIREDEARAKAAASEAAAAVDGDNADRATGA
jgi:hypothetical protein